MKNRSLLIPASMLVVALATAAPSLAQGTGAATGGPSIQGPAGNNSASATTNQGGARGATTAVGGPNNAERVAPSNENSPSGAPAVPGTESTAAPGRGVPEGRADASTTGGGLGVHATSPAPTGGTVRPLTTTVSNPGGGGGTDRMVVDNGTSDAAATTTAHHHTLRYVLLAIIIIALIVIFARRGRSGAGANASTR